MTDQANAALARKLSAGQDSAENSSRSILRAFRLALARSASDRLSLPLSVIGVKQGLCAQDDLAGVIDNDWLLMLFSAGDGAGAVCVDPGCISAIVQTQTIGEVIGGEPQPRAFTDTDAAMAAPLFEDLFKRTQTLVDSSRDFACLAGVEFSSRAEDARALCLGMVNDTYRVFDLTVDLAGGLRQGKVTILLPDVPEDEVDQSLEVEDHGVNLGQASGVMRAELLAMICRMTLPLSKLSDLKPGDVLPLVGARLDRTDIQTIDRARTAVGRLGQCGGMRAVRINEQIGPNVSEAAEPAFLATEADQPLTGVSEDLFATELSDDLPEIPLGGDLVPLDDSFALSSSDDMVAEITQLAGLDDLEESSELPL